MSHLGQRLSGLVDGELSGAERDRVHAHLAGCGRCRAEAAALRALKRRVRGLEEKAADAALTLRLIALAEPGEPVPPRRRPLPGSSFPRPAFRTFSDEHVRAAWQPAGGGSSVRAGLMAHSAVASLGRSPGLVQRGVWGGRPARLVPLDRTRFRHVRYVFFGVMSLLVVGIGGAAFMMGGSQPSPGPRITPPVDMYSVEHAVTTGEVPFPGLSPEGVGQSQKP
jgi:hypothetical protein